MSAREGNPGHTPRDDADRTALFVALRARILKEKERLNERLTTGEISNVEFASEVNSLMGKAMKDAEGILEPSEFADMFGTVAGATPVLMDPAISTREDQSH